MVVSNLVKLGFNLSTDFDDIPLQLGTNRTKSTIYQNKFVLIRLIIP